MTKLRIMSDLHLEFGRLDLEPAGEDVIVLAGDVGVFTQGAEWALEYAARGGVPAVMVAGNHEFYRRPGRARFSSHTVESTIAALRAIARESRGALTFLEDDVATVAGVTFVGATLWTDYALDGNQPISMLLAARGMNDHQLIFEDDRRFTPEDALRRHRWSAGVLRERLPRRYVDGPLVVVTHHLPSARSVNRKYADDILNSAFASHLDDLVETSEAALWVHGHTHASADYRIGGTRVLCNPRGYHPYGVNPDFDRDLIVEV